MTHSRCPTRRSSSTPAEAVDRADVLYTPFYCEENVWHLAGHPRLAGVPRWGVFVSNPDRCCAMWGQAIAPDPEQPVVWDYHVILVAEHAEGPLAYDFDTTLGFGIPLAAWLRGSFPAAGQLPAQFEPMFRVVEADALRRGFCSDRSHMRTETGWKKAPPEWPLIGEGPPNLMRFVDVTRPFSGRVFDLPGLVAFFAQRLPGHGPG